VGAEEAERARTLDALGAALAARVERRGRSMLLESIDGAPAPEHAIAHALRPHGFAARRGALVRLPAQGDREEPAWSEESLA
jgi:hypothetical protein